MTKEIIVEYVDDSFWVGIGCDCCDDTYMDCYNIVGEYEDVVSQSRSLRITQS